MRTPNGYVFYEDDKRICIITGFSRWSENEKTGPMLQSWMLVKEVNPVRAMSEGLDELVCYNCALRGINGKDSLCYVNKATAPYQVWMAWKRGEYPMLTDYTLFTGRTLRLGAYGEPVVVPLEEWNKVLPHCSGWTGYTHQYREHPEFKPILMASCDSAEEQINAAAMGWRTFRVKREWQPRFSDGVVCPASEEGGKRTNCHNCQLCNGAGKAKNVVIDSHGRMKEHFN